MEKEVHIRQREAVPATGSTLQLMPTGNLNSEVYEIDYFCLTGEVDESAKNWIRLYSSVMPEEHTGEERIIVEGIAQYRGGFQKRNRTSHNNGVFR